KEIVVSTLSVLYSAEKNNITEDISADFPKPVAWAFLVFAMLYTPCLATLAVIKTETGSIRWAILSAGLSFTIAWILSFLVYLIAII
ncbi:ferrous iron transport protein B, partial [bacterium]